MILDQLGVFLFGKNCLFAPRNSSLPPEERKRPRAMSSCHLTITMALANLTVAPVICESESSALSKMQGRGVEPVSYRQAETLSLAERRVLSHKAERGDVKALFTVRSATFYEVESCSSMKGQSRRLVSNH